MNHPKRVAWIRIRSTPFLLLPVLLISFITTAFRTPDPPTLVEPARQAITDAYGGKLKAMGESNEYFFVKNLKFIAEKNKRIAGQSQKKILMAYVLDYVKDWHAKGWYTGEWKPAHRAGDQEKGLALVEFVTNDKGEWAPIKVELHPKRADLQ